MVEYTNANLLLKALADRDITSTDTYAKANKQEIELCAADVYMVLSVHPEFREGVQTIKYDSKALRALASDIYSEYGEEIPVIDGTPLW